MGALSQANVISITMSGVPTAVATKNVNNIALFTTETPGNSDVYRSYIDAASVGTDYGSSSVTKDMADAIFAQSPNPLSGGGVLQIIPLLQDSLASAESGDFTTADIFANLASIIAVDDGDLKVTLNGTAINLTNLDFTACTTWADVVAVLQVAIPNAIVSVTDGVTTALVKVLSKKVGAEADVVLSQYVGAGTDLSGASYFNTAAGAATSGTDSAGETIEEAITRTSTLCQYCGVITILEMEDDVIEDLATAIQALDMIFIHHCVSGEDIAGIGTTLQAATDTQTRLFRYSTNYTDANVAKAAYASRLFSVNFSGSNTVHTMNLKTLATITADTGITQTQYLAQETAGIDSYVSYDGDSAVYSTGGNLYADQVYCRMALKFQLQANGYNFLKTTNTKAPQTEPGMDGLKGAYARACKQFVKNGYIGEGLTWNSSQVFGVPEDLHRNITDKGFYIYSQPIADQAQADREAREAPLVQMAIKEAGALHTSSVVVNVEA